MSKNYMSEVAQILGVEINEEFDVFSVNGRLVSCNPYKITNEEMVDCDGDNAGGFFIGLLNGKYVIQKRPWRPINGEGYYYITAEGNVSYNEFSKHNTYDLAMLETGNCFPTRKSAEEAQLEVMIKLEKIKKEIRRQENN